MKVTKQAGNIVDFDPNKLRQSLLKSEANPKLVEEIMRAIQSQLYDKMATKKIYKIAFSLLKKNSNAHAARYNLKTAIELLGPAGFFFEKYVGRLFSSDNYQTKNNVILQGKCVMHEIDVLIKKDNKVAMVECKFHVGKDAKSDVKVPMYILSRFNDLKEKKHLVFQNHEEILNCWIVTNNRFTADAISFSNCMGLNLLSWDFPKTNNIRTKIDLKNLYPVTALTTLTTVEKEKLLILDVILVNEIINNSDSLEKIGLSTTRIKNVIKEAVELCKYI